MLFRSLAVADSEGRNGVWLAEQRLDVVWLDFSPAAKTKRGRWPPSEASRSLSFAPTCTFGIYPQTAFDVVVEIFAQFNLPAQRAIKWRGMRRVLKSGGILIIPDYTPKQLDYGTGGPKQVEKLYTRAMLEQAFCDFRDVHVIEEEREMREGTSHAGMSAMIGLTTIKP